jgi:hypothetical protein
MNAPTGFLAADWRNTIKSLREQFPDADDQTLFDTCDGLTSAADVVAALVRESIEVAAMVEAVEAVAEQYTTRAERLEEREKRLRRAALRLMIDAGMDDQPLRRPEFTLSVSHRKGTPEVYDEEALPESVFKYKTVRSVDRDKLAEAMAAGDVPGVRLTNGSAVLSVRMK